MPSDSLYELLQEMGNIWNEFYFETDFNENSETEYEEDEAVAAPYSGAIEVEYEIVENRPLLEG